jgi:thiol-disulfide isomerase/thioredoxin
MFKRFLIASALIAGLAFLVLQFVEFKVAKSTFENAQEDGKFFGTPVQTLKTVASKDLQFTSLENKTIVFNSWATWCGNCIGELEALEELHKRFTNDTNVVFLSYCSDADRDSVTRLLVKRGYKFSYKQLGNSPGLRSSIRLSTARTYKNFDLDTTLDAVPYNTIIAPNGEVVFAISGAVPLAGVAKLDSIIRLSLQTP